MNIISRDEAISQGLKKYFTGKPCKRGHICHRHVIGRSCELCKRQQDIDYAKKRAQLKGDIIPPFDGKLINRKQALKSGFKYYFTKVKCKNGHIAFRDVVNSNCVHCMANYEFTKDQKEKNREKARQWASDNRERSREIKKNWTKNNPQKIKLTRAKSNKKRNEMRKKLWREKDPFYLSTVAFRGMAKRILKCSGKKKTLKTCDMMHYNILDLKARLEFQFKDGMSWDNYGEWHIDHKKPIARFIRQGITDPAIINALSNLQPLWAKDNLKKSDKWIY